MRVHIAVLALGLLGQLPHQLEIDPDDLPEIQSPNQPHIEHYTIHNRAAYLRAVDEESLRDLMLTDIRDAARGVVNQQIRKSIRKFCAKLPTEE